MSAQSMRKDAPAMGVTSVIPLDKKGFPIGGNIETDDDTAFNRQLPPGQDIGNQLLADGVHRIVKLKPHSAASILASGTKHLGG